MFTCISKTFSESCTHTRVFHSRLFLSLAASITIQLVSFILRTTNCVGIAAASSWLCLKESCNCLGVDFGRIFYTKWMFFSGPLLSCSLKVPSGIFDH